MRFATTTATRGEAPCARARFQRGYGDAALADLRAFLASEPTAAEVQIEIDRLADVISRRADETARRVANARRHSETARALLDGEELEQAVREAQQAIESDPADPECVLLFHEAIERERLARIEQERQRVAAQFRSAASVALDAARNAYAQGDVPRAVSAAENAIALFPSLAEAIAFLNQAREALEGGDLAEAFDAPDIVPVAAITKAIDADSMDVTTSSPQFGLNGRRPEQRQPSQTLPIVRVVSDGDAERQ